VRVRNNPAPMAQVSATPSAAPPVCPINTLNPLRKFDGSGMARPLLINWGVMRGLGAAAVTAMATLCTACLVTQPLTERTDVAANNPPRFSEGSITPTNSTCIKPVGAPNCEPVNFTVNTIVDQDKADELAARWFIDCDGTAATMVAAAPITTIFALDSKTEGERIGGPSLSYTLKASGPSAPTPGVHVVKVLVSDGFAFTTNTTNHLDLAAETKGLATWVWCVDTSICTGGGL
jgi:hypothetical protein